MRLPISLSRRRVLRVRLSDNKPRLRDDGPAARFPPMPTSSLRIGIGFRGRKSTCVLLDPSSSSYLCLFSIHLS